MRPLGSIPLLRGGLAVALAAVSAFHLRLLWSRFADGSVLEPVVAGRWLGSVALVLFLAALRRRGLSLVRGRAALVWWLLVALLHGVGLVPAAGAPTLEPMPAEIFFFATPLGLGLAGLLGAGALRLGRSGGLTAALLRRRAVLLAGAPVPDPLLLAASGPRAPPR